MESTQIHFLAFCVLVNATCMIISWLSQWCERSLCSVSQTVMGDQVKCAITTSHHYDIITGLYRTVIVTMSDWKWPRLGSRAVDGNPFGRSWINTGWSSNEENSVLRCCTTVVFPGDSCVLQMLPRSLFVNLAGVLKAGNKATRDQIYRWSAKHRPWIIFEETAFLLSICFWPKLNW